MLQVGLINLEPPPLSLLTLGELQESMLVTLFLKQSLPCSSDLPLLIYIVIFLILAY